MKILFCIGALFCLLNVYCSFLHYPVQRLLGRSKESISHISGFVLFGSLFVGLSLPALWDEPALRWIGLTLIVFDTGGIHWFAGAMLYVWLRDRGMREQRRE